MIAAPSIILTVMGTVGTLLVVFRPLRLIRSQTVSLISMYPGVLAVTVS